MIDDNSETRPYYTSDDARLVKDTARRVRDELHRFIVGKDDLIEKLLICLLAEGHILLVGNPGVAKTTTAKLFAQSLGCAVNRQQFTPEVLPSDILGSYAYDQRTSEFYLRKGGIFSNIVIVDEVNRATPRTQAALLESMEEKSVTIEGNTFELERPFMVVATESAIQHEGTYPLPTVQLDRFAMRVMVEYPTPDDERQLLTSWGQNAFKAEPVTDRATVLHMINVVRQVYVDATVIDYIAELVARTRTDPNLSVPASPRASLSLLACSRALAAIRGRDYVIPDDVRHIVYPVLDHRLVVAKESEFSGITGISIIDGLVDEVPVSRIEE